MVVIIDNANSSPLERMPLNSADLIIVVEPIWNIHLIRQHIERARWVLKEGGSLIVATSLEEAFEHL